MDLDYNIDKSIERRIKLMQLRIGENILRLRKDRKIRQDELADFLSVTKASVSKWETKQSLPDILLLPQIAAFFNISVDELLGYEPELTKQQITMIYQNLTKDFATKPFEDVMNRTKELVREYYSCFPFLIKVAILWVNHYNICTDEARQQEILKDIIQLCEHIGAGSEDVNIKEDSLVIKAMVNVLLGNVKEVIELLQPIVDSKNYQLQPDTILIQAFYMNGNQDKAELYNQIILYINLMNLIQNSITYLVLHLTNREACELTIARTQNLIELYEVEQLNANTVLQFYYTLAVFYCTHEDKEKAMIHLQRFVHGSIKFLHDGIKFQKDDYFNRLDEWWSEIPMGVEAPRNEKVVYDSLKQVMEHPAFSILAEESDFQYLKKLVQKEGEF